VRVGQPGVEKCQELKKLVERTARWSLIYPCVSSGFPNGLYPPDYLGSAVGCRKRLRAATAVGGVKAYLPSDGPTPEFLNYSDSLAAAISRFCRICAGVSEHEGSP
jgi:hypothetical protein